MSCTKGIYRQVDSLPGEQPHDFTPSEVLYVILCVSLQLFFPNTGVLPVRITKLVAMEPDRIYPEWHLKRTRSEN